MEREERGRVMVTEAVRGCVELWLQLTKPRLGLGQIVAWLKFAHIRYVQMVAKGMERIIAETDAATMVETIKNSNSACTP